MNAMTPTAVLLATLTLGADWALADLAALEAEPNLEKRAQKALDYAEKMLKAADKAHQAGDWPKTLGSLQEIGKSVQLAFTSLKQTGKNPRRSPKHFKRAEIRTRKLLRNLEDVRLRVSFEERDRIEPIRKGIQEIHDDLLEGIMGTGEWRPRR